MTWTITISETGAGTVESVMQAWTDVVSWPTWDERESGSQLDGPFAVGTTGRSAQNGSLNEFVITAVGTDRWTNRCGLPGGALIMDHLVEPLDDADDKPSQVRVSKTYTVTGPLVPLFPLIFRRGIQRDVPGTLVALLSQARRLSVDAGA